MELTSLIAVIAFVAGAALVTLVSALPYIQRSRGDAHKYQVQLAAAQENVRRLNDERNRAEYLSFLNSISKAAIASKKPVELLNQVVAEVQHTFGFDYISIGLVDYGRKEVEVRAEGGRGEYCVGLGTRVPLELDEFKAVNDSVGHLEGDLVLARVGRILEQKCRHSNVVARYGGDEFVVLMPETALDEAQILGERLRAALADDSLLSQRCVTGSFGVATFPVHGSTIEELIRQADQCMYKSK